MKVERRIVPVSELRVKHGEGESRKSTIEGYAAVAGKWSEDLGGFKERIKPGAFAAALKVSDARALFNHDSNIVLGRQSAGTLRLSEDKNGLFMEVDPPDTQLVRDMVLTPIERGDITQQSFGFTVEDDEWTENRETGEATRTITRFREIFDVSPVTFPAYPDTDVALRSLGEWRNKNVEPEPADATVEAEEEQVAVPMHKVKANHRRRLNELKQKQITTKEQFK